MKGIKGPEDVKKLNINEVETLCGEVRNAIINTVSENGGHLASNLGAVELTVALHRSFDSPKDAIIFDVGHQSYTHKLLTGRFEEFSTLRKKDGISGFMRPSESKHDPFVTGHSSNSVSAAYGIYKAKKLSGEEGTCVAVIGDGALTGGMAYEALNNAGNDNGNFIIVLNDNEMSISRNVGSLAKSLTKMRNKPRYHRFKFALSDFLAKIPLIGDKLNKLLFKIKESLKNAIYRKNIFTAMGFNYLGPVDGHNVEAMEALFGIAKKYSRPSVVHVITTKGKGYEYAEASPNNYHGVSPFDIKEGASASSFKTYSDIAGQTLTTLADENDKILAVTAAMTSGTGLNCFAEKHPERIFDVGIAEEHALTFCSGLTAGGMKPFFLVYSSFLQRAYDQIIHDAAIAQLPIKLLVDRAGIVGEDGESHQGLFDVAYLTSVPGMNIYSPSSFAELREMIQKCANNDEMCAVRYPRGAEDSIYKKSSGKEADFFSGSSKKLIITYGRIFAESLKAKKEREQLNILKLNKIYPIEDALIDFAGDFEEIYFFEETVRKGGIAEHFASRLYERGYRGNFEIYAINNKFIPQMKVDEAIKMNEFDYQSIIKITEN